MFYPRASPPKGRPGAAPSLDWSAQLKALAQQCRDQRLKAFYRAGAVPPATPIAEVPLVALDLETTGFNPRRDEIVSIGLIPMTIARIRCSEGRQWVVKPRRALTSESVVIHGITHSAIAAAPPFEAVMGELLEAIAGQVVVVHYRFIERLFLNAALLAWMGEGVAFPVIDTMELEARLYRRPRRGLLARFWRRRPVSIRLADSRLRYHLPHYRPHNALTDALACGELLQAQVAHRFSPETPVGQLWQ